MIRHGLAFHVIDVGVPIVHNQMRTKTKEDHPEIIHLVQMGKTMMIVVFGLLSKLANIQNKVKYHFH